MLILQVNGCVGFIKIALYVVFQAYMPVTFNICFTTG